MSATPQENAENKPGFFKTSAGALVIGLIVIGTLVAALVIVMNVATSNRTASLTEQIESKTNASVVHVGSETITVKDGNKTLRCDAPAFNDLSRGLNRCVELLSVPVSR
jgi:hypothetical protein